MDGDEARYVNFAEHLLNGYYSTAAPNINLWNGPGYPIFLMPFIGLQLPLILITLTNAVMQYLSIVLLYYAILKFTNQTKAILFSLFWACYYIAYQELGQILTEDLSNFLITLILFFIAKMFEAESRQKMYTILTGITLGFLVLTKIIFGYVLLGLLVITSIAWLLQRNNIRKKMLLASVAVAFLVNVPYLIYTYNLTHKIFYWGNSGGMSLYWMSTPVDGEFGDWNNELFNANCGNDPNIPCNADLIAKNHKQDIDYINSLPTIMRDDAYKQIAIQNIKTHPVKYIKNCISNFSRLFFGIPASYYYQREQTIYRIIPNCFVFVFLVFSVLFAAFNLRKLRFDLLFILLILGSYLMFTILVSAYPRQLYIVVPLILCTTSYLAHKSIKLNVNLKADSEE